MFLRNGYYRPRLAPAMTRLFVMWAVAGAIFIGSAAALFVLWAILRATSSALGD